MAYHSDDVIAAIATAPGGAARGIVRLSGPAAVDCLTECFVPEDGADLERICTARVVPGMLRLDGFQAALPCQLYLWPTARSYTREPVAELHLPGSPPLLAAALRTVCQGGARPAEPGEFTLRAFLAGRLDLTQAEAVLGVIDAEGPAQLHGALVQLAGGLSQPLSRLRDTLVDLLAHLEAGLDFVEQDIEFITSEQLDRELAQAEQSVSELAAQLETRGEAAELIRAVLVGPPNAGKSSLFNALAGRQGAIVSGEPGTTRDYLVARLDLGGIPCELVDTAGAVDAGGSDALADAAQSMTGEQHRRADLLLRCFDGSLGHGEPNDAAREHDNSGTPEILVITKCDLHPPKEIPPSAIVTSSRTGDGIQRLRATLGARAAELNHRESHAVLATAVRCRESLRLAGESLADARQLAQSSAGEELVAATLRAALDQLGSIVGAVYTDDLLDRIFSRFCIGK